MAIPHAQPGEVIDVRPLGAALTTAKTSTLLKTEKVEIIRLVMAAGKVLAEHKAPGEITVHCLEGKITFTALGETNDLTAGQLVHVPAGEPHSVQCVEDASFLLTILRGRRSRHHRNHFEDVQAQRLVPRDLDSWELLLDRFSTAAFRHELPGGVLIHRNGRRSRPERVANLIPPARSAS